MPGTVREEYFHGCADLAYVVLVHHVGGAVVGVVPAPAQPFERVGRFGDRLGREARGGVEDGVVVRLSFRPVAPFQLRGRAKASAYAWLALFQRPTT